MTARAIVRQADVERAVRAVSRCGLTVAKVICRDDGFEIVLEGQEAPNDDWRKDSPLYRDAA